MTITAARRRELMRDTELDGCRWEVSEGSVLVPPTRSVVITIGIKLSSQTHGVSHNWRASYGRSKKLRERTAYALALIPVHAVTEHLRVPARKIVFVRLAPRKLDTDNLVASFKSIRDQVCCWLRGQNSTAARADDGMRSGYEFSYHQQSQRLSGIRIELCP